jgi:hypothetical protein
VTRIVLKLAFLVLAPAPLTAQAAPATDPLIIFGIKAGAPRVMALLRRYGVTATFTAAAQSLERAPHLARQIVADGHEVSNS